MQEVRVQIPSAPPLPGTAFPQLSMGGSEWRSLRWSDFEDPVLDDFEVLLRCDRRQLRWPASIAATSSRQKSGMSGTTRPHTRLPSRNAGSSTQVAPALTRSS